MTSRLIRVTQRLALVSLLALGLTQCTRMLPILVDRAPCASDLECPSSELCVMGACLSQDIQATETLSFEVKPPEDSESWLSNVSFPPIKSASSWCFGKV